MSKKRDLLEHLKRDELIEALSFYEIEGVDRRAREPMVEALASSRKASMTEVVSAFSRDRLKELCRALGLDDSGREKQALVDRIFGAEPARASEPPATPRSKAAAKAADEPGLAPGEVLTLDKLERHLWSAADILRGSIDSSDYKNFIFGLLFLKRLSDRFDEECEAIAKDGGDPEDRDEHEFFVPTRARWKTIQRAATGIGEVLNKACSVVEDENSKALEGVLLGMDFNDERKLGDTKQRDATLARLVQHFSLLDLRNANLSEPDMLGRAYEYLIERFADDAGKKGGEFYTPRKVVQLITELLAPTERMRICDPTCGSGGMLIECANYVAAHGGNPKNLSLYGQEKNLGTWSIAKLNMLLHGVKDFRIEKGDTIREPKLVEGGGLMLFDRVIANPPFSLDEWGVDAAARDPYGRFSFGLPPKNMGDLAFLQHMLGTLRADGRAGVVLPHGVLFRGSGDGRIRRALVEHDLIEAIVALPENLFYGTPIPAVVLIIARKKRPALRGHILLVNGEEGFVVVDTKSVLRATDVERIVDAYRSPRDIPGFSRVVSNAEVAANSFILSLPRYIDTKQDEAPGSTDLANAIELLDSAEAERAAAIAKLRRLLIDVGGGAIG